MTVYQRASSGGSIDAQFVTAPSNVTITSSSSAAPTYITGTYILLPTVGRDSIVKASGILTATWDAGGDVTGRQVFAQIGWRVDGGTWTYPVPWAIDRAPGHAVGPASSIPVQNQFSLTAGSYGELRLYAFKNGGSTNTAAGNYCSLWSLTV